MVIFEGGGKMNMFPEIETMIQKVLPLVYDDSLSYLECIEKLRRYINEMVDRVNKIIELTGVNENTFAELKKELNLLKEELEKVKNGDLIKEHSITLDKLDTKLLEDLQLTILEYIRKIARFVFFGINKEGYFYAIIPSSWDNIVFSTDTEGHLCLGTLITERSDFD